MRNVFFSICTVMAFCFFACNSADKNEGKVKAMPALHLHWSSRNCLQQDLLTIPIQQIPFPATSMASTAVPNKLRTWCV